MLILERGNAVQVKLNLSSFDVSVLLKTGKLSKIELSDISRRSKNRSDCLMNNQA